MKRIWILIVLLVIAVGVWAFGFNRLLEPKYQGKRLSYWLQEVVPTTNGTPWGRLNDEAAEAVKQIGNNAVPTLLRKMDLPKNRIRDKINEWSGRWGLKFQLPIFPGSSFAPHEGLIGFEALGPLGTNAIPDLVRMLGDIRTQEWALRALCLIGAPSVHAIWEKFPNIGDPTCRMNIIFKLGYLRKERGAGFPDFIPLLISALRDDPSFRVKLSAATVLGELKQSPNEAVPALLATLQSKEGALRIAAAEALEQFGASAKAAIPMLMNIATNDAHPQVRLKAASALDGIPREEPPAN